MGRSTLAAVWVLEHVRRGRHDTEGCHSIALQGMKTVYWIADAVKDVPVFPYSVYYVYFSQYMTIISVALADIGAVCP